MQATTIPKGQNWPRVKMFCPYLVIQENNMKEHDVNAKLDNNLIEQV